MAIGIGRVCIKTRGREAGAKVAVVDMKDGFAVIDGPRAKRKRCNVAHLLPLEESIDVKKGATHAEVVKLLSK